MGSDFPENQREINKKKNNGGQQMSYIKHLRKTFSSKESEELMQKRKIEWRKQPTTLRIPKPTKVDRARSLGYKAKQGFLIVRQKVKRGGRMTEKPAGGRRTKASGRNKVVSKNYQLIAEERVAKKYPNCEVLNSYYVTRDGQRVWYEVILVDKTHPSILRDKNYVWTLFDKSRVFRGKTSSGKKARGLRNKGLGAEKVR